MYHLKGKTVVITGAASGLGRALAEECHRRGAHLILIDIDLSGLQDLLHHLTSGAQMLTVYAADIGNEEEVKKICSEIHRTNHAIDILINNAGISISQPFEDLNLADYRRLFEVNFWGTVYCTKYLLPVLKAQRSSRIINIASGFAYMGFPGKTAYGSSKSAMAGFTQSLRTELSDYSIGVSLVIPPPMDTNLVKKGLHIDDRKRENEVNFLKRSGMPLRKVASQIISDAGAGKYRITVGMRTCIVDIISRFFPTAINGWVIRNRKRFDFV